MASVNRNKFQLITMSDKKQFRAGVLFGDEVKEVLDYAKANEFALPAVNCIVSNTINAALAAAREVKSPMMIQFSNGVLMI